MWSIYFAYFLSKLGYRIMFWDGDGKSAKIFRLQKKVIRLIIGVQKRESCKRLFREFKILTLVSMYVLEVLCFTKMYRGNVQCNIDIHGYNTRR